MQDLAVKDFKVMHDMKEKQTRGSYARYAGGLRVMQIIKGLCRIRRSRK
jgi:hypothetical protein